MNDQVSASVAPNMVFQNFIGGRERPASDGMTLDVFSPVDGSLFARVAAGTAQDIDEAVKAARAAFLGVWVLLRETVGGGVLFMFGSVVYALAEVLVFMVCG